MKSRSFFPAIICFVLVNLLSGCETKENTINPQQELSENVRVFLALRNPVVLPEKLVASTNSTAKITVSYATVCNKSYELWTKFGELKPETAVRTTTPIAPSTGAVEVYTWQKDSDVLAVQIEEKSDRTIISMLIKSASTQNNFRILAMADETKDGSTRIHQFYNPVNNSEQPYAKFTWTNTGMTGYYQAADVNDATIISTYSINYQPGDKSGSYTFATNGTLILEGNWDAIGNGSMKIYPSGQVVLWTV